MKKVKIILCVDYQQIDLYMKQIIDGNTPYVYLEQNQLMSYEEILLFCTVKNAIKKMKGVANISGYEVSDDAREKPNCKKVIEEIKYKSLRNK